MLDGSPTGLKARALQSDRFLGGSSKNDAVERVWNKGSIPPGAPYLPQSPLRVRHEPFVKPEPSFHHIIRSAAATVLASNRTEQIMNAYDVIVVGARCAGSPTAMLLTRKGYRV